MLSSEPMSLRACSAGLVSELFAMRSGRIVENLPSSAFACETGYSKQYIHNPRPYASAVSDREVHWYHQYYIRQQYIHLFAFCVGIAVADRCMSLFLFNSALARLIQFLID